MIENELRAMGATYKIDRISGEGGSASVYKAFRLDSDGHSRQTVALKILKNKNAISWLRKEFETLTQIRSVHCAQIFAWETLSMGPALMMEWIDGVTLLDFARGHHFQPSFVSEIVAQTEAGLRELSALGLHHGDLSPKNILIDRSGLIRLVDFATASSKSGEVIGTPAYLSPEIWRGAATSLESDLYALAWIEFDALQSFRDVPATAEACRRRADESSVIHEMNHAASSAFVREQLALAVSAHLDVGLAMCGGTQLISNSPAPRKHWSPAVRLGSLLAMVAFSLMIVTVRAQAPLPSVAARKPASLKVASHRWIHLTLNGKEVGYAPVSLKNLNPGPHRLVWKTSTGRGETRIQLAAGQQLLLRESDLSRLE